MSIMAVNTQGFQELQSDLIRIATSVSTGAAVNRALRAGAVPIEEDMRRRASSDPAIISGALHEAIGTGNVKSGVHGKRITIGVHRKDWNEEDYYPAYVEYGHGGPHPAPPHPYVRPAFDTNVNSAFEEMRRVLENEIK